MGPQSHLLFTTREPYHADPVTTIDLDRSSLYVAYSHKDTIWFDRLSKVLEPSKHNIDLWEDMYLGGNNLDTILYSRVAVLVRKCGLPRLRERRAQAIARDARGCQTQANCALSGSRSVRAFGQPPRLPSSKPPTIPQSR